MLHSLHSIMLSATESYQEHPASAPRERALTSTVAVLSLVFNVRLLLDPHVHHQTLIAASGSPTKPLKTALSLRLDDDQRLARRHW